ncbi:GNAT family N-acetyltransferase [Streptomyces sp. NPDC017993]|uniref:GNAT family N-acetyltransferase n=1 Tax=Streptomyces sp. NPDC017993 TaxID=3365027 RepID=UPI0037AA70D7
MPKARRANGALRPDSGGPALQVRAAHTADLEAIATLHSRARAAYHRGRAPGVPFDLPAEHTRCQAVWARALEREDTLCAVRHGTVLGAASYGRPAGPGAPEAVTLHQLQVDPDHWRTGVGRALHTACLHAWRTAGFSRAALDVVWHNRRARAFYTGHGWRPDPRHRPAPDATHLTLTLSLAVTPLGGDRDAAADRACGPRRSGRDRAPE